MILGDKVRCTAAASSFVGSTGSVVAIKEDCELPVQVTWRTDDKYEGMGWYKEEELEII